MRKGPTQVDLEAADLRLGESSERSRPIASPRGDDQDESGAGVGCGQDGDRERVGFASERQHPHLVEISKVSALVHLLYTGNIEATFDNVHTDTHCPRGAPAPGAKLAHLIVSSTHGPDVADSNRAVAEQRRIPARQQRNQSARPGSAKSKMGRSWSTEHTIHRMESGRWRSWNTW
jgi:hypothetical protein